MVVITIETIGDEKFIRGFNRIGDEVKDFSEPFAEIYVDFTDMNRSNFGAEGYPEAWVPLSPKYAAWKQKHFPGRPLMVLRGDLKASLVGDDFGMGFGAIREIHAMDAEFGTSVPYAHRHQVGWEMPRRKVVQLTDADKIRWGRIIHTWAVRKLRAATVAGGATPA